MKSLSIIILSLTMLSGCALYNPDGSTGGHNTDDYADLGIIKVDGKIDESESAFITLTAAAVISNNPEMKPAMSGVLSRVIDYADDADNLEIVDIDNQVAKEIAESKFTAEEKVMAESLYTIAKTRVQKTLDAYTAYKWDIPDGVPAKMLIDSLRAVKKATDAR